MLSRAAVFGILLLAGASPGWADAGSEQLLRNFLGTIEASADWTAWRISSFCRRKAR